jgi:hypothetical protein
MHMDEIGDIVNIIVYNEVAVSINAVLLYVFKRERARHAGIVATSDYSQVMCSLHTLNSAVDVESSLITHHVQLSRPL